jgi:hypothetical protein
MGVKAFRIIFRLDFPIRFKLADDLGRILDMVQKITSKAPFKQPTTNKYEIVGQQITNEGVVEGHKYNIVLSPTFLTGEMHFQDGIQLSNLSSLELFKLADEVLGMFDKDDFTFNRIGLRVFAISGNSKFTFQKVHGILENKNDYLHSEAKKVINTSYDMAIVAELKNEADNIRITFGPYHKREYKKYFNTDPGIQESIILDIDLWQEKTNVPEFRMKKFAVYGQEIISKICENVENRMLAEVSK